MRRWLIAGVLLLAGAAQAETIAITGARIHTLGGQGTLENATILFRDGRIVAVDLDGRVELPDGARWIEARGRPVTPGLIDAHSHFGLVEVSGVEETVDSGFEGTAYGAAFDVRDAINPASILIPVNRIEGITRAVVAPQRAGDQGVVAGRGAIMHLGSETDYLVQAPAAIYVVFGETGAGRAGGSRAAAMLEFRELLQDARDFRDNRRAWEGRNRRDYAAGRLDLEALQPVLQGQAPVVVSVHRASDIRATLRLAEDFGLKLVIHGGTEAWRVADVLSLAGVPVLLDPMANLPSRFESLNATSENAARLFAANVPFAFATGSTHNARNLTQAAGNAVAHGLPWDAALAALTRTPAEIFGIADRAGTLEPGKVADVVLWDGDPLEVTSYPDRVFINGREIPIESRQTLLRDRYLNRNRDWPPAYERGD